jgi:hypothetical protein
MRVWSIDGPLLVNPAAQDSPPGSVLTPPSSESPAALGLATVVQPHGQHPRAAGRGDRGVSLELTAEQRERLDPAV